MKPNHKSHPLANNSNLNNRQSRPRPLWGSIVNLQFLDAGLILLGLLAYILFLTGDYFVPFGGALWLVGALVLLALGIGARVYLTYRPDLASLKLLVRYWPLLVLGVALLVAGFLRYQTLKNAPNEAALPFATEAVSVLRQDNWQPKSFVQPPLYLYLGAGVSEISFLQQASARKVATLATLNPASVIDLLRLVNLLLGLLALWPTYAAATLLGSRREGAVAALLLATSWLAYQATPALLPFTLGAALAASSLYFMVRGRSRWDFGWAGALAGLATAATYGAVLLLVPLGLAVFGSKEAEGRYQKLGLGLAGWLVAWTVAVPGWLLSFNNFVSGLAAIGKAPAEASSFYLKQALTNDGGLVIAFGVAFVAAFALRGAKAFNLWLALGFPLLYFIVVVLAGPALIERLALVVPLMAIAAAQTLGLAADWIQRTLDAHDDRHKWAGTALALGLVLLVALISELIRRAF